ncbi:hypothetical protein FSP39_007746 [Pinctada imbricata]|uniref:Histone-lysine N-methyltransferase SETMAR n=1 Tax=Pinctada imbricata TaxID=66713 RepID=A0AA88XEY8_PINIB|nr:hypothetical protein FSP39_007746 [Pinctada imbricata]
MQIVTDLIYYRNKSLQRVSERDGASESVRRPILFIESWSSTILLNRRHRRASWLSLRKNLNFRTAESSIDKGVSFHKDNAPVHMSVTVMDTISDCGFNLIELPPYSPDRAPSDFHLFRKSKAAISGTHFQTDNDAILAVDGFLTSQDKGFFKSGIEALQHRMNVIQESIEAKHAQAEQQLHFHNDSRESQNAGMPASILYRNNELVTLPRPQRRKNRKSEHDMVRIIPKEHLNSHLKPIPLRPVMKPNVQNIIPNIPQELQMTSNANRRASKSKQQANEWSCTEVTTYREEWSNEGKRIYREKARFINDKGYRNGRSNEDYEMSLKSHNRMPSDQTRLLNPPTYNPSFHNMPRRTAQPMLTYDNCDQDFRQPAFSHQSRIPNRSRPISIRHRANEEDRDYRDYRSDYGPFCPRIPQDQRELYDNQDVYPQHPMHYPEYDNSFVNYQSPEYFDAYADGQRSEFYNQYEDGQRSEFYNQYEDDQRSEFYNQHAEDQRSEFYNPSEDGQRSEFYNQYEDDQQYDDIHIEF